jgi:uncharacterized membrane protein
MSGVAESRARLDAIDVVRGAVMILMVLDHTRDFVYFDGLTGDPLNPATSHAALYLTRWLTHLCAPTFVLLAGLGVGLRRLRSGVEGLAWFAFTRGLWLVIMELTIVRLVGWFNVEFLEFFAELQVIWAIGVSMMVLALLVRLPPVAVGGLGAAVVVAHNTLDGISVPFWVPETGVPAPDAAGALWMLLHQSAFFPIGGADGPIVWVHYPVLPWFGVLAVGYTLARLYQWPASSRRRALTAAAVAMPIAFVLLRTWNLYGDPGHWAPQPTLLQSAMSYLNVQKYGPSLDYVLVMLSPACAALAALDGRTFPRGAGAIAVTFGRVPFFFYVLQWVGAHIAGIVVTGLRGGDLSPYFMHVIDVFRMTPAPVMGGPLWLVYVCWILVVLALYLPCRWFARIKAQRREWWLSYL